MRILICSTMYPPDLNGQSVFCNNLVEGLANFGHQVMLLHPACSRSASASALVTKGVQVESIPGIQLGFIHPDLRLTFGHSTKVRSVFDRFQPNLVHVQDSSPLCQAVLREARRRGIPSLATHHPGPEVSAPYFVHWPGPFKWIAEGIAWRFLMAHLNQADQVTVPSRSSVKMLAARGLRSAIRPLSCGIHLDDFYPNPDLERTSVLEKYGIDPERPMILYVGRVDGEKRVDVLVRSLVCEGCEEVQLVIAGTGSMEPALQRLAKDIGVQGQVHFLGKVQHADLPELLNSTDIFAMPGDAESFSIATLEAMACGKPILAANAAALPELVTHLVNGYLFTRGQPADAARGIQTLLRNRADWPKMGQVSIQRVQSHRFENILQQYDTVYRSNMAAALQGGITPHPSSGNRRPGWLFKPVLLLVLLSVMLFSQVLNPLSTQAAPLLQLEVHAPFDMDEIREFLDSLDQNGANPLESAALIQVLVKQDEQVRVIVIPRPKNDTDTSFAPAWQELYPTLDEGWQSLGAALIDLGVPEEMVDLFNLSVISDDSNRSNPWPGSIHTPD